jgi:hypothetical protein
MDLPRLQHRCKSTAAVVKVVAPCRRRCWGASPSAKSPQPLLTSGFSVLKPVRGQTYTFILTLSPTHVLRPYTIVLLSHFSSQTSWHLHHSSTSDLPTLSSARRPSISLKSKVLSSARHAGLQRCTPVSFYSGSRYRYCTSKFTDIPFQGLVQRLPIELPQQDFGHRSHRRRESHCPRRWTGSTRSRQSIPRGHPHY